MSDRPIESPHDVTLDAGARDAFMDIVARAGPYRYFWTLSKDGSRKRTLWYNGNGRPPVPDAANTNVYFGVHGCSEIPSTDKDGNPAKPEHVRARLEAIASASCVYAEFDAKDFNGSPVLARAHVQSLDLPPSAIVASGGGYHCYWFFDAPLDVSDQDDRERLARLQEAWVAYVGGDTSAHDLPRILRVPGTLNYKYDPPRPVELIEFHPDRRYAYDELAAFVPSPQPTAPAGAVHAAAIPSTNRQVTAWAQKKIDNALDRVKNADEGDKHDTLLAEARLLGGLIPHGLADEHDLGVALLDAIRPRAANIKSAEDTIADGLGYGKAAPLRIPEFPTDQPLLLINGRACCPSCDTPVERSRYPYFGTQVRGWYCRHCKYPMVWPLDAYTPVGDGADADLDTGFAAAKPSPAARPPVPVVDASAWEPAIPLDVAELPSFPLEVFPDWLQTYVEALAAATETPSDLAAMLMFSVLATVCQGKAAVHAGGGWIEPLNLFVVIALAPGNRKSTVFRFATEPIVVFERDQAQQAGARIAEAQTRQKLLEGLKADAERRAIKADDTTARQDAEAEALHYAVELEAHSIPPRPRLIVDDVTPETVASILAAQDGRLAVLSAEATVFDLMAGRYSSNGPNFDVYLKGHAGDALRIDRASRSEYVEAPALTLGITVQPSIIRGLAQHDSFRGRGLVGRFLYALPESNLGRRTHQTEAIPEAIRARYSAMVTALLALPAGTTETGTPAPHVLQLDDGARRLLLEFRQRLEPKLAPSGELGHMTDWAGKLAGAILRIAGLLHLARRATSPAPWHELITAVELAPLVGPLALYLIEHARAAYATMGADPIIADARYLLGYILRREREEIALSDVYRETRAHFKKPSDLTAPAALLVEYGWLRPLEGDRRSGPGRPAGARFAVNPLGYRRSDAQNTQNTQNAAHAGNFVHSMYFVHASEYASPPPTDDLTASVVGMEGAGNASQTPAQNTHNTQNTEASTNGRDPVEPPPPLAKIEPKHVAADRARVQELIDSGLPKSDAVRQAIEEAEASPPPGSAIHAWRTAIRAGDTAQADAIEARCPWVDWDDERQVLASEGATP